MVHLFRIRTRFYELCNPSLLVVLKENVQTLSEKWSELAYIITEAATDLDDAEAVDIVDNLSFNPFQVKKTQLAAKIVVENDHVTKGFAADLPEKRISYIM